MKDLLINGNDNFIYLDKMARNMIEEEGLITDYISFVDPNNLKTSVAGDKKIVILIAAHLNKVRLIDNIEVDLNT